MKNFERHDLLFSLCGLNCGLCPMKLSGYCPSMRIADDTYAASQSAH